MLNRTPPGKLGSHGPPKKASFEAALQSGASHPAQLSVQLLLAGRLLRNSGLPPRRARALLCLQAVCQLPKGAGRSGKHAAVGTHTQPCPLVVATWPFASLAWATAWACTCFLFFPQMCSAAQVVGLRCISNSTKVEQSLGRRRDIFRKATQETLLQLQSLSAGAANQGPVG